MDQFEKYESLYWDLAKKDKCHVENTTGCLYPCSFHEYRVADKQVKLLLPMWIYESVTSRFKVAWGCLVSSCITVQLQSA